MYKSVLKRIFNVSLTLWLVSILAFFLMKGTNNDVILDLLESQEVNDEINKSQIQNKRQQYAQLLTKHHLDKSLFYFSINPRVVPSKRYVLGPKYRQDFIKKSVLQYGNQDAILNLNSDLDKFLFSTEEYANKSDNSPFNKLLFTLEHVESFIELESVLAQIRFDKNDVDLNSLDVQKSNLLTDLSTIITNKVNIIDLLPSFRWNGLNNQYHYHLINLLSFNWGRSFIDQRFISTKIFSSMKWTFVLSFITILIIFAISIPLGVYLAINSGSRLERWLTSFLYFWKIVPMFWLATLLVIFLTSDYYGTWLNIFEGPGLGNPSPHLSFWDQLLVAFPHLVLPLICMVLPNLAYLTQQMKTSFLSEMSKEYVLATKAQGLPIKLIIRKYIFPNSLFPILTIIGGLLPALISGSLVIEIIFNIPGMGRLAFESIQYLDWQVLNIIIMLTGILTIIGLIFSDVLYYVFDPRIRKKKYV